MSQFYLFLAVGSFLIILEILTGFVFFWFFLIGLASVLTALSVLLLDWESWESAFILFSIYAVISTIVTFKWIKPKLASSKDSWQELVGQLIEVTADILPGPQGGRVRWSGVDWKARLVEGHDSEVVASGSAVKIVSISGTTLFVEPSVQPSASKETAPQASEPASEESVSEAGDDGADKPPQSS